MSKIARQSLHVRSLCKLERMSGWCERWCGGDGGIVNADEMCATLWMCAKTHRKWVQTETKLMIARVNVTRLCKNRHSSTNTHIARERERERAKNACTPRHVALFLFNFSVRKFFAIDTFPSSKERYFFDIALRAEILYRWFNAWHRNRREWNGTTTLPWTAVNEWMSEQYLVILV